VPMSTLTLLAMAGMSVAWRKLPDSTMSTVSGHGMQSFVKGAAGATRNVVPMYPRVSDGALAEYVKPGDVCFMQRNASGTWIDAHVTIERTVDGHGGLQLFM